LAVPASLPSNKSRASWRILFAACCRYRKRKSKRPLGRLVQASPLPRGGIDRSLCTVPASLPYPHPQGAKVKGNIFILGPSLPSIFPPRGKKHWPQPLRCTGISSLSSPPRGRGSETFSSLAHLSQASSLRGGKSIGRSPCAVPAPLPSPRPQGGGGVKHFHPWPISPKHLPCRRKKRH